jgi:pSer/pThr/pTyr-binding forkhead associated (FHA) protein
MNNTGAKLIIRHGSAPQQEYEISGDSTVLGREAINEVVLFDPEVSRQHTRIILQDGRYIIEDLGSTNGTFVNEHRITSATPLNNGDLIEVGEATKITFLDAASAMDATIIKAEPVPGMDKTVADPEPAPVWEGAAQTPQPAAYQAPPPPPVAEYQSASQPPPGTYASSPAPEAESSSRNRYLIGCGCLTILLVFLCAGSLFVLDALAPDILYCSLGGPVLEGLGFDMACP